jgi:hypothetical protein
MNGSIPLIVRDGRISLGASFAWKMATLATINSSTVSASFAFTSASYLVTLVRNGDTIVVLLCGGDKGSQRRDIQRAITMAKGFRMAITVKKWDVADYLKSADDIAAYLEAVIEDGDTKEILQALRSSLDRPV